MFRTRLMAFLNCLPGLTNLSVLLQANDNQLPPDDFKTILDWHGQDLRSLVWDERPMRIDHGSFTLPYSRIEDIQELCPNLVELGIPMDWSLFTDTDYDPYCLRHGERGAAKERLSMMRKLRTLNIRNMPLVPARLGFQEARSHSTYAESVLDVILDYSNDTWPPPPLDTLVLGSFTYRDHQNGLGCYEIKDVGTYKYRQPHVYRIDREYHHEGRRKPLAILHETGTYEETEAAGGSVEVLKPYWLA
ncbi:MAG: hypothetical protein Q9226_004073 [Calogaya cf. arnoldii]